MSVRVARAVLELTTDSTSYDQGIDAAAKKLDDLAVRSRGVARPLADVDTGLRSLARTSRGLVGPLTAELAPAFDGIGIRMAHVLMTSTQLSSGMGALTIAAAGLAGVIGGALFSAWQKNAAEAAKFQSALNSMDTGQIQGELDRLMKKLDEAAIRMRFLQGPAGAARPAGAPVLSPDFPFDVGTAPLLGGTKDRDQALRDLARAREQLQGVEIGKGEAGMADLQKMLGQNLIEADKIAQQNREHWITEELKGWAEVGRAEEAAIGRHLTDEATAAGAEFFKNRQFWIDEDIRGMAEVGRAEEAAIGRALMDEAAAASSEFFKNRQFWIDEDIRGMAEVGRAEEAAIGRAATEEIERATQALEARKQTLQGFFDPISASVARGLSSIVVRTQSVEQAFADMGRNIAASLIENVVNKGLKVVMEQLQKFLEEIARVGLTRALVGAFGSGAASGAGGGATTSTATAGSGTLGSPGSKQHGGIVSHRELTWIGEAGPEAVIPLQHGAIPVTMLGGTDGGGTVIQIINQGEPAEATHQESRGDGGERIYTIVMRAIRRASQTGDLDTVMGTYNIRRPALSR